MKYKLTVEATSRDFDDIYITTEFEKLADAKAEGAKKAKEYANATVTINYENKSGFQEIVFAEGKWSHNKKEEKLVKEEREDTKPKEKKSVYQMVTDKIINQLEQGIIPWEKPWTGMAGALGGAFNRKTKKAYSFINQCMLSHDGEYASFKQWQEMGGHIKKGEHGEFVVFWKILPVKETNPDTGKVETKNIPMLRYYNVFHISQVEGVEPLGKEELATVDPVAEAEELIAAYTARENIKFIREMSNRAYYSPSGDYVSVPLLEQFPKVEEAYSTYFHELTHSTGHKTRLDRFSGRLSDAMFGSESYSKEELVAEMGAAMILNRLGIETEKSSRNNAAYIQSWLKVLKSDVRFVTSAASKAEKAVKFIYGESQKGEGNDEE